MATHQLAWTALATTDNPHPRCSDELGLAAAPPAARTVSTASTSSTASTATPSPGQFYMVLLSFLILHAWLHVKLIGVLLCRIGNK